MERLPLAGQRIDGGAVFELPVEGDGRIILMGLRRLGLVTAKLREHVVTRHVCSRDDEGFVVRDRIVVVPVIAIILEADHRNATIVADHAAVVNLFLDRIGVSGDRGDAFIAGPLIDGEKGAMRTNDGAGLADTTNAANGCVQSGLGDVGAGAVGGISATDRECRHHDVISQLDLVDQNGLRGGSDELINRQTTGLELADERAKMHRTRRLFDSPSRLGQGRLAPAGAIGPVVNAAAVDFRKLELGVDRAGDGIEKERNRVIQLHALRDPGINLFAESLELLSRDVALAEKIEGESFTLSSANLLFPGPPGGRDLVKQLGDRVHLVSPDLCQSSFEKRKYRPDARAYAITVR